MVQSPADTRAFTETEALHQFAEGAEPAARRAFDCLAQPARRFLRYHLASRMPRPEDAEEVVQETLTRIWALRPRFQDRGPAAWYALLRRTAENCRADWFRARPAELPLEDPDLMEPLEEELPLLDRLLSTLVQAEAAGDLEFAADTLWLGLEQEASPAERARQLLAAQLYYLDGEPWDRTLRLVAAGASRGAAPDRATLDGWLQHPGVLRLLAYAQLFRSNEALARELLGLEPASGSDDLDCLMQQACGSAPTALLVGSWSAGETRLILWRYRYGLLMEHILSRRDCPFTREESAEVTVRLAPLLPFSKEMKRLRDALEHPWIPTAELWEKPSLWQRLAFQYAYFEGLSHADIGERLQPAAEVVEYRITPGMLNMWLSGGRLVQRLARFCCAGLPGEDA